MNKRVIRPIGWLLLLGALALVGGIGARAKGSGVRIVAHREDVAPKIVGDVWFNAAQEDLKRIREFKGRVTVMHFWTFECINCKHNLPYVAKVAAKFDSRQVQVIGIHTPELPNERKVANVQKAIADLDIIYPVVVDGEGKNWDKYKVEAWPTVFLIDKQGRIRNYWVGELVWGNRDGYKELVNQIQELLKEE